jgi:hypothetical protein
MRSDKNLDKFIDDDVPARSGTHSTINKPANNSSSEGSFNSAFAAARKAGKEGFTWKGKRYTTEVKKSGSGAKKEVSRDMNTGKRIEGESQKAGKRYYKNPNADKSESPVRTISKAEISTSKPNFGKVRDLIGETMHKHYAPDNKAKIDSSPKFPKQQVGKQQPVANMIPKAKEKTLKGKVKIVDYDVEEDFRKRNK